MWFCFMMDWMWVGGCLVWWIYVLCVLFEFLLVCFWGVGLVVECWWCILMGSWLLMCGRGGLIGLDGCCGWWILC